MLKVNRGQTVWRCNAFKCKQLWGVKYEAEMKRKTFYFICLWSKHVEGWMHYNCIRAERTVRIECIRNGRLKWIPHKQTFFYVMQQTITIIIIRINCNCNCIEFNYCTSLFFFAERCIHPHNVCCLYASDSHWHCSWRGFVLPPTTTSWSIWVTTDQTAATQHKPFMTIKIVELAIFRWKC